jgi:hypothetical protein
MAVSGAVVEGAEGRGIGLGLIVVVGGWGGALGVDVPDDDAEELCNLASRFKRIYNTVQSRMEPNCKFL